MKRTKEAGRNRTGFSLVELVVVVLIMGILAAVAAPRMFDKMTESRENATKQSLAVLRSAIELYKLENGSYPADPASDLENHVIKGPFPSPAVLSDGNSDVKDTPTADPLVVTTDDASWVYNSKTGEIRINDADYITW